ncbi:MAG: phosphate/phosphite/phosphonate ABC transporter substrate-binding protein [Planctomycetota bacterium]
MSQKNGAFSLVRLLVVVVPILLIAYGVQYLANDEKATAQEELNSDMLARLLGTAEAGPDSPIAFTDEDGDLVCDSPAEDACVTPEKLIFSYIAEKEPGETPTHWQGVLDALSKRLGIPVEYKIYTNNKDQLSALASGELHITAFNTGAVPLAVKTAGFVPVCTFGRAGEEGDEFGYTMQFIVPADSPLTSPGDLKSTGGDRTKVTFETPTSNSGCKAALVLLMDKHGLLPEQNYDWGFSMGHESSILGVASGELEIAPVASDILARMQANNEFDAEKVKTIYTSERFPQAAIGYAHNLAPPIREAIAEALLGFEWAGSSLEGNEGDPGDDRFVPVDFKEDWANVRRIDEAVRDARNAG